jgi:hypothetical protein
MYECMYACMYVCMFEWVDVLYELQGVIYVSDTYIHTRMYACMYACMFMSMNESTFCMSCKAVSMFLCINVCVRVCVRVCMCVCMHFTFISLHAVCVYVCMHVCTDWDLANSMHACVCMCACSPMLVSDVCVRVHVCVMCVCMFIMHVKVRNPTD